MLRVGERMTPTEKRVLAAAKRLWIGDGRPDSLALNNEEKRSYIGKLLLACAADASAAKLQAAKKRRVRK